jgi:hypothetical protein
MSVAGASDLFRRRAGGTGAGTGQAAGFDLFPSVFPTCSGPVPMQRNRSEQVSDFALTHATCSRRSRVYDAGREQVAVGRGLGNTTGSR